MLDGLISGDISLVADLTDVKLINGMQTVPAKVRLRDNVSTLGASASTQSSSTREAVQYANL